MIRNLLNLRGMMANNVATHFIRNCWSYIRFPVIPAFIFTTINIPTSAQSAQDYSQDCDHAAAYAAQKTGVPISVLQAISLTETGRKQSGVIRPWPWTVNMEGDGVWFESEDGASAYVYKNYKRGARSFDVGCFQINYKWHGHEFSSIEEMFEPNSNALYAAKFLMELYREKGDWSSAAGAYHSRTQKYAEKYEKRFNSYRMALLGSNVNAVPIASAAALTPNVPKQPVTRINRFQLLQENSSARTLGSLVPLGVQHQAERLIPVDLDDG